MSGDIKFVGCMALLTCLSLFIYLEMDGRKRLELFPGQFPISVEDDSIWGGSSSSSLNIVDGTASINCEIRKSAYEWPYCAMGIDIASIKSAGVDLSEYEYIRLNIGGVGDTTNWFARLFIKSFGETNPSINTPFLHKYNGIEFNARNQVVDIPIDKLEVMNWWLINNRMPIEHSEPELDEVSVLQVATASQIKEGNYHFYIRQVELVGHHISKVTFVSILLLVWLMYGLYAIAYEIIINRRKIKQYQSRQEWLLNKNEALKEQNQIFANMAHRDPLTGVFNRKGIRFWLQTQMQLLKWESRKLSVLYIDIDGFKQFNDQHGHQLGDDLLRQFAVTLQELIEPCDHVVRWGGEEFLIFCPELDTAQSCELAELIRQRTMNSEWFNNVKLTCSIGVARVGIDGYQNAIIKADEALFSAKSKGGNRVELAENKAITMTELEVFV
ncbi:hypothetical protein AKJ18_01240 [Vibrio xuii]|nr:hypothetical protein AKJ18_01240 [Vibrio xuii]